MIHRSSSITLSNSLICLRLIRTKENIQKVKYHLRRKGKEYQLKDYRWSLVFLKQVSGK